MLESGVGFPILFPWHPFDPNSVAKRRQYGHRLLIPRHGLPEEIRIQVVGFVIGHLSPQPEIYMAMALTPHNYGTSTRASSDRQSVVVRRSRVVLGYIEAPPSRWQLHIRSTARSSAPRMAAPYHRKSILRRAVSGPPLLPPPMPQCRGTRDGPYIYFRPVSHGIRSLTLTAGRI